MSTTTNGAPQSDPPDLIIAANDSDSATPAPRIQVLDVLRGVAVLGALFVSIWMFGGFSTNKQIQLLTHPSGGNYRLFATISLLFEGKMLALISLIFGTGMLLFMQKHATTDKIVSAADLFIRRQMWLIGFGIINAVLFLWSYDVLFQLGVVGILLFPFMRLKQRGLMIASMVCLLIFCGKQYWDYTDDKKVYRKYLAVTVLEKKFAKDSADRFKKDSLEKAKLPAAEKAMAQKATKDTAVLKKDSLAKAIKKDTLTKKQAGEKAAWEGMVKNKKYDPKKDDGSKKAMRESSYEKLYDHLLPNTQAREAEWTYRKGLWELAMMILLGMALFKAGFFNHRFSPGRYLAVGILLCTIGLLFGWFRLYFHNATLLDYEKYIKRFFIPYNQFAGIERAALAIGYASLAMWITGNGWMKQCMDVISKVGRLSLTNYLLQSIFCALFFTGFGSGNYGKLSQWQLYFLVVQICLVQIVFSIFWCRYYAIGPAEWLLRCAIMRRWLPFEKNAPSPGASETSAAIS